MTGNKSAEQTAAVLQTLPKGQPGRIQRIALITLLLLSCLYFTIRGPVRAARRSVDFPVFYSASRAWLLGSNPYDNDNINAVFRQAGGPDRKVTLSLNPPLTFPLLAPLSILPYPLAKYFWLGINVALAGAVLYGLVAMAGLRFTEPRTLLFLAFAITLAPLHTSISQGQLTIVTAAFLMFALRCDIRGRDYPAGVLLMLAAALRPQMVIAFGFYYLLRLRWRVCVSAIIVGGALAAIAVARMEFANVPWLSSWMGNITTLTAKGGPGDPTQISSQKFIMIDLQILLHTFFADRLLVKTLVIAFVGVLGACLLVSAGKLHGPRNGILIYSILSLLSLLVVHNLFYDTILLVFPLVWAFALYRTDFKRIAPACMILIVPFLVPGAAVLNTFVKRGFIPEFVSGKWWWNSIVLPHQIYALVLLASCLVYAAIIIGRRGQQPQPAEAAGRAAPPLD